MNHNQRSRLPDVGETIFTVMNQLAAKHGALNLAQGYPDFDPPAALRELVEKYLRAGVNQYAPMTGVPELREALAAKIGLEYGRSVNADTEITVTVGATEALFSTIQALVHPGDEVIVFDPAYDAYEPAVQLAGGMTRHIPLSLPGFGIDWERVADTVNARTRLIVINSPHNPSGALLGRSDMAALGEIVKDTQVLLLADEVYEHIVFDGRRHESLHRYPALAARAVIVSSFGKTYHATGWRTGYAVAPSELAAELRKVHQYVTFSVMTPVQHAYAEFVRQAPEFHRELSAVYQPLRDRFCTLMEASRFRFKPSAATYFQLLDYGAISDMPDVEFARRLTRDTGVAAIPVSVFCAGPFPAKLLRFCFAKDDATLKHATERLCRL